ncbi:MAG: hypothetical protein ACTHOH_18910, partial [Lysobacteraceae bacterium]
RPVGLVRAGVAVLPAQSCGCRHLAARVSPGSTCFRENQSRSDRRHHHDDRDTNFTVDGC